MLTGAMGTVIFLSMKCSVEDCGNPVCTRGLCRAHYQRKRKAGELVMNTTVLAARGRKIDHPLYTRWNHQFSQRKLSAEWHDFWRFVDDVGDPNGCTKLWRPDQSKPLGPDNFRWAEKLVGEKKNAYYRDRYRNNPKERDARYQRAYGISLEEYESILDFQGGVCAICGEDGQRVIKKGVNEEIRRLAVDHDHTTGAVRGLLCGDCNMALGLLKDNPDNLISALSYYKTHQRGRFKVMK